MWNGEKSPLAYDVTEKLHLSYAHYFIAFKCHFLLNFRLPIHVMQPSIVFFAKFHCFMVFKCHFLLKFTLPMHAGVALPNQKQSFIGFSYEVHCTIKLLKYTKTIIYYCNVQLALFDKYRVLKIHWSMCVILHLFKKCQPMHF